MLVTNQKIFGRIATLLSLLNNNIWLSVCLEIFFGRLFLQDFDNVSDQLFSHRLVAKLVLVLLDFSLALGSLSSTFVVGSRDCSSLLVFVTCIFLDFYPLTHVFSLKLRRLVFIQEQAIIVLHHIPYPLFRHVLKGLLQACILAFVHWRGGSQKLL